MQLAASEAAGSAATVRVCYLVRRAGDGLAAGQQPVGQDDGLYFRHTDYLGSTPLLTDGDGNAGSVTRYYLYREYRAAPGTVLTNRG